MTQQERLNEILMHLRTATELAAMEVQEQKQEVHPMTTAFRAAAKLPESASSKLDEISGAFNRLTANLLSAGMRIRPGNEIHMRVSNAVNEALTKVLQKQGPS